MITIGSRALNHHIPNYSVPNDVDFIGTEMEVIDFCKKYNIRYNKRELKNLTLYIGTDFSGKTYEFEVSVKGRSSEDYLNIMENEEGIIKFASLEVLYSLKKSHINFPINFDKHIKEYHFLKDLLGEDNLKVITDKRYNETKDRFNVRLPKLNQTVEEFVSESQSKVNRIYDHDDIHRIVAHGDKPAYFKIQPDTTKVWCSEKMWNELEEQEKIEMVLEEAYVIALERRIIPMLFQSGQHFTTKQAVEWSLMRICTTLASGYFRQYAVDNYFKIKDSIDLNFINKFFRAFEKGDIKYHPTYHKL